MDSFGAKYSPVLIVLSTQRSGSTMVCDDISGTNALGRPSEYFLRVITNWKSRNCDNLRMEVEQAWSRGKTNNGVIGVKVMSNQIIPLGKVLQKAGICDLKDEVDCVSSFFSGAIFARVVRQDKVAQAVSRVMVKETSVVHVADSKEGLESMIGKVDREREESSLEYSRGKIEHALDYIVREEKFLDDFVSRLDSVPTEVFYEDVVSDRSYVLEIAKGLGVGDVMLQERRLKKVGGQVSEAWIRRFKSGA
jgi:LPS sulfotransferase NodH